MSDSNEIAVSRRCEKIGEVPIDTGCLVLVDPCRVGQFDEAPVVLEGLSRQQLDDRSKCFAVTSTTGLGDGRYPIFAEIQQLGAWGERVVALHIFFHPSYCFADEPEYAKRIAEEEKAYLMYMNNSNRLDIGEDGADRAEAIAETRVNTGAAEDENQETER